MPQQFSEVVEGIGSIQFASVDQAHVQVADLGTIHGLIKERVLPMKNRFFQRALNQVVVQWSAWLAQKQGQGSPVPQHVFHGLP